MYLCARACEQLKLTQSSEHIPLCICKGLSLFHRDGLGEFFLETQDKLCNARLNINWRFVFYI